MPRNYKRKPGTRRYADYSTQSLNDALQACPDGMPCREAAEACGIPKSTLNRKMNSLASNAPARPIALSSESEASEFAACEICPLHPQKVLKKLPSETSSDAMTIASLFKSKGSGEGAKNVEAGGAKQQPVVSQVEDEAHQPVFGIKSYIHQFYDWKSAMPFDEVEGW
uniref:HTH psq-type domain-containing protein n=1 Tax=Romanomermis culicivorax TaxID=13658 RepID=A0A915KYN8_ROMCU